MSKINQKVLERWDMAVKEMGIPAEAYDVKVRVVKGSKSSYSFGLILNPYRFRDCEKPVNNGCSLCYAVENAEENEGVKIYESENYVVIPNITPVIKSACVVIRKGIGVNEKEIYRTTELRDLEKELEEVFGISNDLGISLVHNSDGAGASISRHEHWHLIDYNVVYDDVGRYGYDLAEIVDSSVKSIRTMPDFPFAHLIFEEDPEKTVHFLRQLHSHIGDGFEGKGVPHGLIKSSRGVLVVPAKVYKEGRGAGGGDMAGHLLCKTDEEFSSADYNYCVQRLGETLFKEDEIDLVGMLKC